MGALAVVALKVRGQLQSVLTWIALNLVFTFTVSGISWQGHIGGLLGGVLIGAAMVYAPRKQRSLVQWSSAGAVLLISLVLVAFRVAALG
jgi:membrane associated rhomboid family serine protease